MRSDFYSLWKLTQNKKHSEKHTTRRASVERLEDRQLLAVTAVAALELAAPVESPAEVRAYDACDDFGPVELGAASYNSVNTLVVNTAADTLDDGSLSLRQAMLTANDGDKIVFSPALGDNVVINVTSPLKIASSISVEGAGRVTIAGNDTFGLLEMDASDWRGESHDVSISGLTFTHGSGRKGVAIGSFDVALTVSNCVFTDNGNTVDSELMWTEGGGISQAGGSLTVKNSSFVNNHARVGGAILTRNCENVTIRNSVFDANNAYVGGAISAQRSRVKIYDSKFFDNVAIGRGGGVSAENGSLYVMSSRFEGNNSYRNGGAIELNNGEFRAVNSAFFANNAGSAGGAVYANLEMLAADFFDCTIAGNTAEQCGGVYQGTERLAGFYNTIVDKNRSRDGNFDNNVNGEVAVKEYSLIGEDARFVVDPAFDAQNRLSNRELVDLNLRPDSPAVDAGSMDYATFAGLSINSLDIAGNKRVVLSLFGEGTIDVGAYEYSHEIVVDTALDVVDPADAFVSLREAVAMAGYGDKIVFSPALGDNVVINVTSTLNIATSVFIEGAGRVTIAGNDTFGLLELNANDWLGEVGFVTLDGLTFTRGGGRLGVAIRSADVNLVVNDCVFTANGNVADFDSVWTEGGAISQSGGALAVVSSSFNNNYARVGGAILARNCENVTIRNSVFDANNAYVGGAISVQNSNTKLYDCDFFNNAAFGRGGAFSVDNGTVYLEYSQFEGNTAMRGGALDLNAVEFKAVNSVVFANNADLQGGGVIVTAENGGRADFYNCTIAGNTADQGGGVYQWEDRAVRFYNTIVAENRSRNGSYDNDVEGIVDVNENSLLGTAARFVVDPAFDAQGRLSNRELVDLELRADSPAVDAGSMTRAAEVGLLAADATDIVGHKRVSFAHDGGIVDIGAYEYLRDIVVTTNLDVVDPGDGLVSLREAAAMAGNGDTIRFDLTLQNKTIVVSSPIVVECGCSIVGDGWTLAGDGNSELLRVDAKYRRREPVFTVSGLNFENGYSAGIISGSVTVKTNSVFENCRFENNFNALYNSGAMKLVDCEFVRNESRNGGAAVLNRAVQDDTNLAHGVLAVIDTRFSENRSYGGSVIYSSGRALSVTNSHFEANSSQNASGAISCVAGNLYVSNSDFASNSGAVGAISAASNATTVPNSLNIADCVFNGNTATQSSAAVAAIGVKEKVSIRNCDFIDNDSGAYAAVGIVADAAEIVSSYFAGNASTGLGGALYAQTRELTLDNSAFVGNTASFGGAVYYYAPYQNAGNVEVLNCTIAGNSASQSAGGLYIAGAVYSADGELLDEGTLELVNTIVAQNYAPKNAQIDARDVTIDGKGNDWREVNIVDSDPLFVVAPEFDENGALLNRDTVDLRLSPASNAIDRGAANGTQQAADLNGSARVVGDAIDLGAYEYASAFDVSFYRFMRVETEMQAIPSVAGKYTYAWYVSDTPDGEKTAIEGENTSKYTPPREYLGKYITVAVVGENGMSAATTAPLEKRKMTMPNVKTYRTSETIGLTWKSILRAKDYTIYYKPSDSDNYIYAGRTTDTRFELTGLDPATSYDIRVKAISQNSKYYVNSDFKNLTVVTKAASTDVTAPRQLVANDVLATSFVAQWFAGEYASSYRVTLYNADRSEVLATYDTADTRCKLDGLTPSTAYSIDVVSLDKKGRASSAASLDVETGKPAKLFIPSMTATATSSTIEMKWKQVDNAQGYIVYLKEADAAGAHKYYKTTSADATSLKLTGLKPGTEYSVRVKAKGDGVDRLNSDFCTVVVSTRFDWTPDAPTQLEVVDVDTTSAQIGWKAVQDADSYYVNAYDCDTNALVASVVVDSNTAVLTGLAADTRYQVEVVAVAEGASSQKATLELATLEKKRLPAPIDVNAEYSGDRNLVVQWQVAPEVAATSYRVILETSRETRCFDCVDTRFEQTIDVHEDLVVRVFALADPDNPEFADSNPASVVVRPLNAVSNAVEEVFAELDLDDLFETL